MLHSFHCHYPPPQTPHSPSSQGKIVHKTKLSVHVSAERQSSRAGGLRLTVRHPSPCLYTPRRKPASEPCTHRAPRAQSESRFSKRQTLAVCSCRHAAVLREFQSPGGDLVSTIKTLAQICLYHSSKNNSKDQGQNMNYNQIHDALILVVCNSLISGRKSDILTSS